MITTVLFDVDGVFFDSFNANLKFFQTLIPKAGYTAPTKDQYSKMFHLTMIDVIRNLIPSKSEEEIKRVFELGKSQAVNYPYYLIKTPAKFSETLLDLAKHYKLGVVTSRIKGSLFNYPQMQPVKDLFQTAVYFEDTQKHKPDPDPLLLAAKRLGSLPEETVYVGDAPSDQQAAKKAGMKFIHYSISDEGTTFSNLVELIVSKNR